MLPYRSASPRSISENSAVELVDAVTPCWAKRLWMSGIAMTSAISLLSFARISAGTPFLGICVGMQWMLAGSSEAPQAAGLGAIDATCERFAANGQKVPHVGWNQIEKVRSSRLLEGIESGSFVYYSHSYCAPLTLSTVATTEYGGTYSAVLEHGHLFGVQFHPEKSGPVGVRLLKNFCDL